MKQLIFAMAALVISAKGQARSIQYEMTVPLQQFHFQAGSTLAQSHIEGGQVTIQFMKGEIEVVLQPTMQCPKNAYCTMMMPAPISYQVPIQSRVRGACGEIIYAGQVNHLPVDGIFQEIRVVDNRMNTCQTFAILPTVEVQLRLQGGRPYFNEIHFMSGSYQP